MNYRSYISVFLLLLSSALFAQDFDRQTLSDLDILGTARYVSMAGAMSAVGGDVSAAQDNPAALGVFRRGELSFTMSYDYDVVKSANMSSSAQRVFVPQMSWVINFPHSERQKGLLTSSLMLQYHRRKQFLRNAQYAGEQSVSITDLMADLTNGLDESALQSNDWYNNQVGALSKTGYELYLIDPLAADSKQWRSVLDDGEKVATSLKVSELGSANDYSVGWGANVSNKFWFGLSANLTSIRYSRTTSLTERPDYGGTYTITSTLTANGFGFHANLGMIAQPVDFIRLGLSVHTPTWTTMKFGSSTTSDADMSHIATYNFRPDPTTIEHYTLPMRTTCGMAFLFATNGMLSFEYDWTHQPKNAFADLHQLKIGAEIVVKNNCFLRAGYAYSSRFLKTDVLFAPRYDDLRTDTDFKNTFKRHYASVGIGFRNRFMLIELAYQCKIERSKYYAFARPLYNSSDAEPFEWQSVSFDHRGFTHLFVLSLGWTPRRQ